MLIENWKKAWKFFSVQAMGFGVAMSTTYGLMYDQLKDTIPAEQMAIVTAVVFVVGILGRLKKQNAVE